MKNKSYTLAIDERAWNVVKDFSNEKKKELNDKIRDMIFKHCKVERNLVDKCYNEILDSIERSFNSIYAKIKNEFEEMNALQISKILNFTKKYWRPCSCFCNQNTLIERVKLPFNTTSLFGIEVKTSDEFYSDLRILEEELKCNELWLRIDRALNDKLNIKGYLELYENDIFSNKTSREIWKKIKEKCNNHYAILEMLVITAQYYGTLIDERVMYRALVFSSESCAFIIKIGLEDDFDKLRYAL